MLKTWCAPLYKNHLEAMMKLSICVQKGKEVRKAIITLTKESNAEYIFKRLFDSGWLVVESIKVWSQLLPAASRPPPEKGVNKDEAPSWPLQNPGIKPTAANSKPHLLGCTGVTLDYQSIVAAGAGGKMGPWLAWDSTSAFSVV
jgi:hypothetical protein